MKIDDQLTLDNGALLCQEVGVLLLRSGREVGGTPQVRGQETRGLGECMVHSHGQVTSGTRVTSGGGVHVLNTRHGQQLLGDKRRHDTGSTRSGDQSAAYGSALAGHLTWYGVGKTRVKTPVSSANRDQVHLGVD